MGFIEIIIVVVIVVGGLIAIATGAWDGGSGVDHQAAWDAGENHRNWQYRQAVNAHNPHMRWQM